MKLLFSTLFALLVAFFPAAPASAQTLFGGGGAYLSQAAPQGPQTHISGTHHALRGGLRLRYNDFFRLEMAAGYGSLLTLEGALHFYPLQDEHRLSPYLVAGFGRYLSEQRGSLRSVVPLGAGLEYRLLENVALNVQLAGRWTLDRPEGESPRLIRSLSPTLTLAYDLTKFELSSLIPKRSRPAQRQARRTETPPPPTQGNLSAPDSGEARSAPRRDATEPEGGMTGPEHEGTDAGERPGEARTSPTSDAATPEGGRSADAPDAVATQQPGGAAQGEGTRAPAAETSPVAQAAPSADTNTPAGGMNAVAPGAVATVSYGSASGHTLLDLPPDDEPEVEGATLLPAGSFIMGLTDADPLQLQNAGRKRVTISSFYIDRHEVSNQDYRAYVEALSGAARETARPDSAVWEQTGGRLSWNDYYRDAQFSNYPVVGVTYEQAQSFCRFHGKRLPTEAEWEYAARGGLVGGVYPWPGFEPRNAQGKYLANYNPGRGGYAADGYAFTAPVAAYPPNRWGLYNMSGNVAEWVADAYTPTYAELSDFNPLYEEEGEALRVVRGGSWASGPFYIGVGVRDAQPREEASPQIGFRCAIDVTVD